ncbi:hypothetical protein PCE1_004336 [Barthelona sp. PCE]
MAETLDALKASSQLMEDIIQYHDIELGHTLGLGENLSEKVRNDKFFLDIILNGPDRHIMQIFVDFKQHIEFYLTDMESVDQVDHFDFVTSALLVIWKKFTIDYLRDSKIQFSSEVVSCLRSYHKLFETTAPVYVNDSKRFDDEFLRFVRIFLPIQKTEVDKRLLGFLKYASCCSPELEEVMYEYYKDILTMSNYKEFVVYMPTIPRFSDLLSDIMADSVFAKFKFKLKVLGITFANLYNFSWENSRILSDNSVVSSAFIFFFSHFDEWITKEDEEEKSLCNIVLSMFYYNFTVFLEEIKPRMSKKRSQKIELNTNYVNERYNYYAPLCNLYCDSTNVTGIPFAASDALTFFSTS